MRYIGYKKLRSFNPQSGVTTWFLAELEILGPVVQPYGKDSKCRTTHVRVLRLTELLSKRGRKEIGHPNQVTHYRWGGGMAPKKILYRVGRLVKADKFDHDSNHDCSNGIHFFWKLARARQYH